MLIWTTDGAVLKDCSMVKDKTRYRLLFGPYNPPRTSRGKFLTCEMCGKVKVGDYSDGPIPWPVKWRTRNSLILCWSLVEAVRHESEVAVAHHWGVCTGTVQRWRRALEVEVYNAGTCTLQRAVGMEHGLPSKMKRLSRVARDVTRKPKPKEWRKQMSRMIKLRIRIHGPINPKHRVWTPADDRVLGTKSDEAAAKQLERSTGAIRTRRCALGIPIPRSTPHEWSSLEEELLGTDTDAEIAKRLGRNERGVELRRQSLGIAAFRRLGKPRKWTSGQIAMLGKRPDRVIARLTGRSLSQVQIRRHLMGRPNPSPVRRLWTPAEDLLLVRNSDEKVAQITKRSEKEIGRRRRRLGIPNPGAKRRFWRQGEIDLLGTLADREVARRLGCPVRSVVVKRTNMGIRAPDAC